MITHFKSEPLHTGQRESTLPVASRLPCHRGFHTSLVLRDSFPPSLDLHSEVNPFNTRTAELVNKATTFIQEDCGSSDWKFANESTS